MGLNKLIKLIYLILSLTTKASESFGRRTDLNLGRKPRVTFFDLDNNGLKVDFTGQSNLVPECANLQDPIKMVDTVGSVEHGCAKFWEKVNCNGWMAEVYNNGLRPSVKHNDKIQSVSSSVWVTAEVVLFENTHFDGKQMEINVYNHGCKNICSPFNKWVSAVMVLRGCARFWDKANCNGWAVQVSNKYYQIPWKKNDEIKSISTCY